LKARTILDELTDGLPESNRNLLIESRGNHIIVGALNLLSSIREHYGDDAADEMERRLINSIKGKDPLKFSRAARRLT
jgi:hypothetical protein